MLQTLKPNPLCLLNKDSFEFCNGTHVSISMDSNLSGTESKANL